MLRVNLRLFLISLHSLVGYTQGTHALKHGCFFIKYRVIKMFKKIVLIMSLGFCTSYAMATPAKLESIEQMLVETEAKNLMAQIAQSAKPAIEQQTIQAAKEMLQKEELSANELAIVMQMQEILFEEMSSMMSWEKMKAMMIKGYQQTFTEEEIQASLRFYRTPEGKSMMQKMPQLMQNIMQDSQTRWSNFAPSEKALKELQVLREKLLQTSS
ncbi:DUF2059 domain-containing protein [Alkanindiges illinoisensis]|uniref:DUF2059 domain-containing protein n=1 Tax=Alkanindiges illinoisensis TaxID=197183 RepID=UPI000A075B89|nr:DUF2059 domain-containing protein [Alkanindiges illinoisensis]